MKRIKCLLLGICLSYGFLASVWAKELDSSHIVDFSKKGSIEVILQETNGVGISDVEITIYKVADATSENGNLVFNYAENVKFCSVSLENLKKEDLSSDISKCITDDVSGIKKVTDSNGMVKFSNLDLGLYLVVQTNEVEGYSNMDSFLVMIPKVDDDNNWIYDIHAIPKMDIYRVVDITVNKVWNTNNEDLPESVEIELYKEDELIDTVILNAENNWSYTWDDLVKSDKYRVVEVNVPKGYAASYRNNDFIFTVTNTDSLAHTGQLYYSIIVLAVMGLLFILVGFFIMRRG